MSTAGFTPAAHSQPQPADSLSLAHFAIAIACIGVIFASLAAAGAAFYEMAYRGRIFPGVRMWGVDLSGLRPEEAALALAGTFSYDRSPAFLLWDGADQSRQRTLTPADLGVSFDLAATVTQAYQVGRSRNVLRDWAEQFQAWHSGWELAPVVVQDQARTLDYLNALAQETYRPVVEASLRAEGTNIIAAPGQVGRQLDVAALLDTLNSHIAALDKAAVPLPIVETAPLVMDASAQAAAAQALLSQPFALTIANPYEGDPGPWTLDQATLGSMLRITRVEEAGGARFDMALDPAALRAYLEPLAPDLQRKAANARFIFNDETRQLEVIQPAREARELDIDATIAAINAAVTQDQHSVALVFRTQPPEVTEQATAEQLGIRELVSEQFTSFKGSGPERMQNIQTAAARFHGLLVPPGGTFSFVENIGDISLDSGFAEALIIYGGRTIRGVGGGVCQVSTTLFRTIYFGGFPIVERNSHAYRVGYYEQRTASWQGPGLDAAVYAPIVDLKFQNDTPYWLLMETYFSPNAGRLTWKFYSTSDGRQVQVSGPMIENEVPAPEPLYEENPELPKGEIKQVDYAAVGAEVTVTRVVTRDGVQINTNEPPLRTAYEPWRAIYQYGPGTEGIPTPTPTPEATTTPTP
jgi:vancomycin resistance protein YoaR